MVSTDKKNVADDTGLDASQCAALQSLGQPCPSPTRHHLRQDKTQERKDEAKLKADEFNLQVADDQLKKDESRN